jgi:hypothetical protein
MIHIDLNLNPEIEKQFVEIVENQFEGSYEKFIESIVSKKANALSKLASIAEELGINDLAENHDKYLYSVLLKPLRNSVIKYDDPTMPVGLEDWDALK